MTTELDEQRWRAALLAENARLREKTAGEDGRALAAAVLSAHAQRWESRSTGQVAIGWATWSAVVGLAQLVLDNKEAV